MYPAPVASALASLSYWQAEMGSRQEQPHEFKTERGCQALLAEHAYHGVVLEVFHRCNRDIGYYLACNC